MRKWQPATVTLIAVNVIIYVAMVLEGGSLIGFRGRTLLLFGANFAPEVLGEGQYWRLFTSTMVHANLAHVAMNMIALWQVGVMLEPRWGTARILATYIVTGLAGSLASLMWYGVVLGRPAVSVGASGAIMGLIGAAGVTGHLVGGRFGLAIRNAMLRWALIVIAFGFFIGADNAAHTGGLVAGAIAGFTVEKVGIARRGGWSVDLASIVLFLGLAGGGFALALVRQPF